MFIGTFPHRANLQIVVAVFIGTFAGTLALLVFIAHYINGVYVSYVPYFRSIFWNLLIIRHSSLAL